MGWLALLVIGAATMGGFVALGVSRRLWSFVGSALMLAAAGYALEGRPGMPARPAIGTNRVASEDPGIVDLRDRMFGRFTNDGAYVVAADALLRAGDPDAAVQVTLGGIRAVRDSALLWTELGGLLAIHDGHTVSEPSRLAFEQARRLAPLHPGPPFFEGLSYARAGDLRAARPLWRHALRLSPPGTSYHRDIVTRLALLDQYLASVDGAKKRGGSDQPR